MDSICAYGLNVYCRYRKQQSLNPFSSRYMRKITSAALTEAPVCHNAVSMQFFGFYRLSQVVVIIADCDGIGKHYG